MKKQSKKTIRPYVIVRGYRAGVHAGELVARKGQDVTLANARRIWFWSGAASLSELAVYGAKNSDKCRFGVLVERQEIVGDACEIIYCQPAGEQMIRAQPDWRA
jgi:hypothetical protein